MTLTDDNYYSVEADKEYMSCSQFQGFLECEAKQLAKLQGRWVDGPKEAFLVGNYFHSFFEGEEAHEKFCKENANEIYSLSSLKKYDKALAVYELAVELGQEPDNDPKEVLELKAPYKQADKMIEVVLQDKLMKQFIDMPGNNEIIIIGEIWGVKWKGKLDKFIPDMRFIVDYKTVANIWETSYNPVTKMRETFVEAYGYIFRAAAYSIMEIQQTFKMDFETAYSLLQGEELDLCDFLLLCVSKQDYPDKEIIRLNHSQAYVRELDRLREPLYRMTLLKDGRAIPKRCGTCDYCRSTKQIKAIKPYYELIPDLRTPREEDDYKAVETEKGGEYVYAGEEKSLVKT